MIVKQKRKMLGHERKYGNNEVIIRTKVSKFENNIFLKNK